MEQHKLIVRTVDATDRRVRIPQITAAGRRVYAKFAVARDAVEARALDGVSPRERTLLMGLLARVADRDAAAQLTS